jgi:mono/diheme cytochrome c family protein
MHRALHRLLVSAIVFATSAACYVGPIEGNDVPAGARPTDAGGGGTGDGTTQPGAGLPCDVDALLAQRCRGCHVSGGSAPMPLVSYVDLSSPSKSDAAKTTAVASIERLRSADRPMPPAPLGRVPSSEIAVLEQWVAAGMPRGECGAAEGNDGGGGGNVPAVCTSGTFWSGNRKGPTMQPGRACITCHESEEDDPVVWVGGTVYPTLHEPDGCYGVAGEATVVITDAAGRVVSLPVGSTGNFSLPAKSSAPLTMPIRAKVVKNGKERAMATPQSTGNCNGCHTQSGANGAPGRILAP